MLIMVETRIFSHYTREMVWEVVRWCWLLMENIDRVPGMDNAEKTQLVAEAKMLDCSTLF